jgi:drug/metabolite transporter (DMT)-like permease
VTTLGLAAALAASVFFNVGVALQALDAREEPPEQGMRLSLLGRLLRRPRWLLGFVLGALGFPLEVLAFAKAPFVVVQPALAAGLILLLVLGVRILGERVGRIEVVGVGAIIVGMALVAWGAPDHTEAHRGVAAIVSVVGALSILALVPFALRGSRFDGAAIAILGSALGFAASNVATKLMSDEFNADRKLAAFVWLLVAFVTGIAAIVTEMTALQRAKATVVVPVSFAIQTFLPIVLEPLFLRERWATVDYYGAPLMSGMVLLLAGTLAVARTRAVTELVAAGSGEG